MGKVPTRILKKFYLGEWIEAIAGRDRKGAAHAAGVDVSYINNLCGEGKRNPSARVMLALSEYLGVTVNDLYQPPPARSMLDELSRLSRGARESLLRDQGSPSRRK